MSQLGVNLHTFTYHDAARPFINAVEASYPTYIAHETWYQLFYRLMPGEFPTGTHRVTFQGKGRIRFGWIKDGSKDITQSGDTIEIYDGGDGAGVKFQFVESDPSDPIRNLAVVHVDDVAAYDAGQRFRKQFTDALQSFKVLRFMDTMLTNHSEVIEWEDYSKRTEEGYPPAPIHKLAELCNLVGADMWVCVPHLASDEFVRQLALEVDAFLAEGRRVYLEYSNENWHWSFSQASHCKAMSDLHGLGNWMKYSALRSMEIWKVFAAAAPTRGIVRVLGTQLGYDGHLNNAPMLEWMWELPGVQESVDAIAVAPYFGDEYPTVGLQASIDKAIERLEINSRFAREHGKRLIAYEAGQHVVMSDVAANVALQESPEMAAFCGQLLDRAAPYVDLVCWYNFFFKPSGHGAWGLHTKLDGQLSGKAQAVMSRIASEVPAPEVPAPPVEPVPPVVPAETRHNQFAEAIQAAVQRVMRGEQGASIQPPYGWSVDAQGNITQHGRYTVRAAQ